MSLLAINRVISVRDIILKFSVLFGIACGIGNAMPSTARAGSVPGKSEMSQNMASLDSPNYKLQVPKQYIKLGSSQNDPNELLLVAIWPTMEATRDAETGVEKRLGPDQLFLIIEVRVLDRVSDPRTQLRNYIGFNKELVPAGQFASLDHLKSPTPVVRDVFIDNSGKTIGFARCEIDDTKPTPQCVFTTSHDDFVIQYYFPRSMLTDWKTIGGQVDHLIDGFVVRKTH